MKVLELFSGTGSVGKVARERGHEVVSIENDPCFEATYCEDILTFDFSQLETPDFIWASPPCTTFTLMIHFHKPLIRGNDGAALTDKAREGDALLHKTIDIVTYFRDKNPHLLFVIENPRAYMRKQPCLQDFKRATTSYNHFGFPYMKATDFFSNFEISLPRAKRMKTDQVIAQGTNRPERVAMSRLTGENIAVKKHLGRIPPLLVDTILQQVEKA